MASRFERQRVDVLLAETRTRADGSDELFTTDELRRMIASRAIRDAKTLVGLMYALAEPERR